ncbi:hypothetical protein PGT21_008993 [Puccinia graminis f. sp. tritici]|uniref:Uncharacterized protein n=1 Tax=Puccinia graminis f. sp. tritici TaxID=56615 RepID=A0A5B0MWF1_PUCGR|nr:hypothetical protein PGT21_008993 [Puccinia graminis f. sp. tritici]KAA1131443.1 hypothetical protein PGTUg99_014892 [Puccinia graminis f. sp. tritici]
MVSPIANAFNQVAQLDQKTEPPIRITVRLARRVAMNRVIQQPNRLGFKLIPGGGRSPTRKPTGSSEGLDPCNPHVWNAGYKFITFKLTQNL